MKKSEIKAYIEVAMEIVPENPYYTAEELKGYLMAMQEVLSLFDSPSR